MPGPSRARRGPVVPGTVEAVEAPSSTHRRPGPIEERTIDDSEVLRRVRGIDGPQRRTEAMEASMSGSANLSDGTAG